MVDVDDENSPLVNAIATQKNVEDVQAVKKKLNGYVGFANLPNQIHRKSVKRGFQFTLIVVGTFLLFIIIAQVNGLVRLD